MTQEQFKKAINDRSSQITNLKKEIKDLEIRYIEENCEFEIGELVVVIEKPYDGGAHKEHTAFIGNITVSSDGVFNYSFYKQKKDKTPSPVRLRVWGHTPEVKKLSSPPIPDQNQ